MNAHHIRQKFLDYFQKNGHEIVASSSLIPAQDPTILFANAGMNQFKDCFLGREKRSYVRAASSQKCVRAGGKHNDLENVGFTARHLTFFEMLGNFSFGDYFKKEAIAFAWELLTKELGLPADKLYVTVFQTDDEAYAIWRDQVGVPEERITRLGEKDNFWQMGDTGPCGPCSEIYIDRGSAFGSDTAPGGDGDRFIEIWNLVFMQFDRQSDGTLVPLKQTGVDTGMGLERLTMIMQGKSTVFETDLFNLIHKKTAQLTDIDYETATPAQKAAFNVLADHVRSSCCIIADGGSPSNEGRGYVLRKIIRRAALFAQKFSNRPGLFYELAPTFIQSMAPIYPELATNATLITAVLKSEVEKFAQNLIQGKNVFEKYADEVSKQAGSLLSGAQVFKLYDTYGFPPELTKVMATERNLAVDMAGFESEMTKQQAQSHKKAAVAVRDFTLPDGVVTTFVGYEKLETTSPVLWTEADDSHLWLVTKESPFYVESGGQVNDSGWVVVGGQPLPVVDLKKIGNPYADFAIVVCCTLPGGARADRPTVAIGDVVQSMVDPIARANTVKNHTATHLLQAALIQVLGKQVKQAGSVVHPDYLRFDFTHHEALTPAQIEAVENLVNQQIQADIETEIFTTTLAKAQEAGVIAFFGEKYNVDKVRVVKVPGFSAELCGGTHAPRTGIIGAFKITAETALATGTRRMIAVTGPEAIKLFQLTFGTVKNLGETFKVKPEQVLDAIHKLRESYQSALSEIKMLKKQLIKSMTPIWQSRVQHVGKVPFVFIRVDDMGSDEFRMIAQELEKQTPGMYVMTSADGATPGRINFMAYVAKDWVPQVDLKLFGQKLQQDLGLRSGGNQQMLQGSGSCDVHMLEQTSTGWVRSL